MYLFTTSPPLMEYGVCTLSVIPMRIAPSSRSEMISQLLFGEFVEILDRTGDWLFIRSLYDDYEGWIDFRQISSVSTDDYRKMIGQPVPLCGAYSAPLTDDKGAIVRVIVSGSSLPGLTSDCIDLGGRRYFYKGKTIVTTGKPTGEEIIKHALSYLGAPYLWGGRSPFGIDCSGFVQVVFKLAGHVLPRDASQQSQHGETINFLEEAAPGDLVFFDNTEGTIIHTGILTGNNTVIHSSGCVRTDSIDHEGIFNHELQKYSHRLRIIKRLL